MAWPTSHSSANKTDGSVGPLRDGSRVKALGQYPTPSWVAEALVERHFQHLGPEDLVIEPACGPGAFLSALPDEVPALGVEIDPGIAHMARISTGRDVVVGDFRTVAIDAQPTAIIGNPPFKLEVIDGFLDRAFAMLPENGRVGFVLPAYAFQTAERVAGYADRWSLFQEMIPRNIFPGLSLPLLFALFTKERVRRLIGFALYRETADVQRLPDAYREVLSQTTGGVWRRVVELALAKLGGEADLPAIYAEIEGHRPTRTQFWREQVRRTLRRYADSFLVCAQGRYALESWRMAFLSTITGTGTRQLCLVMP